MLLYTLLFILIAILIFLYFFLKKDIAQPSIIFIASYVISVGCCIFNIERWNVNFRLNTFIIFLLGTIEFVGICIIIHYIFENRKNNYKNNQENENNDKPINNKKIRKIPIYICVLSIIYCIAALIIRFTMILNVAKMFGEFSNFSEALTIFKANTSYTKNYEIPHFYNLISKPIIILAYVFLYYFIKRVTYSDENKLKVVLKNFYYLIPSLTYMVFEFISSNRLSIISLIIAAIIIGLMMYQEKNNKVIEKNKILTLLVMGIIGFFIFYASASFIGRKNTNNFFRYITLYCGGSIECFNRYLQDDRMEESNNILGEETFYYLIDNVNHYLHTDIKIPKVIHLEFRYNDDIMIGNVYTAYRRWYSDFGILGIVLLNGLMAGIYQSFYEIIRKKINDKKNIDLLLIIYSYIAFPIFLHPIDSYYTLLIFRLTFITTLFLFFILYYSIKNTDLYFENKKIKIIFKDKNLLKNDRE